MIIYQKTVSEFINDSLIFPQNIGNIIKNSLEIKGFRIENDSIINSWKNSLPEVAQILMNFNIEKELDVAIEYVFHLSKYRLDFMLYGEDDNANKHVIIIELKQWSECSNAKKRYFIHTNGGDGIKDYWHPSYQAYNYANIIRLFNEYVRDNNIEIISCSFLHNMDDLYGEKLKDISNFPLVTKSPVFLKNEKEKLSKFISNFVKTPSKKILYEIDNGKISPSKKFGEMLNQSLKGIQMFSFDDSQAFAIETCLSEVQEALRSNSRRTIIIKGSPGTGKSIVALNILGQLINSRFETCYNACYTTANSAPRQLMKELFFEYNRGDNAIANILKSPVSFAHAVEYEYDCIIVDEAHRVYKWKGGVGLTSDIDVFEKIFYASRVNVFFIDEDQAVTTNDFVTIHRIREYAKKFQSRLIEEPALTLTTQFRILGGQNYMEFILNFLGYTNTMSYYIPRNYDFRIYDNPFQMREDLRSLNNIFGKSRMVAGYTYEWISKKDKKRENKTLTDINLEFGFQAKWNLGKSDYSYANDDDSFDEVGCIHTIQGLDLNYAAVIIGKDLSFENGNLIFDKTKIAKSDRSSGIRTADDEIAKKLIRNTYNVLLTRGIRGTFVYCEDKGLRNHLKTFLGGNYARDNK